MNAGELHHLARVLRDIAIRATSDPGELPVSPGDLAIIEDISHHRDTPLGDIAKRTGLAQSLVSKTVARMRDAGVVRTKVDTDDRRRVLIAIDPKMRKGLFRTRAARPIEPAIRGQLQHATDAELAAIVTMLDRLLARLAPP
jgi:DNA-binding MarR family transcriptional regulator